MKKKHYHVKILHNNQPINSQFNLLSLDFNKK